MREQRKALACIYIGLYVSSPGDVYRESILFDGSGIRDDKGAGKTDFESWLSG